MAKKTFPLLAPILLLLVLTVPAFAAQKFATGFSDVPGNHWAAERINLAANKKWVLGYDDGTFRPDQLVTRAELASIMARAGRVPPVSPEKPSFSDTGTDQWFSSSVEAVKNYFAADPSLQNGLFRPYDPVTRQEAAAAMALAAGGAEVSGPSDLQILFADYESINPAYRSYISLAVKKALIKGYPDGYFRPETPLTRSEAISLVFKVFYNDITIYGLLRSGVITGTGQWSTEFARAEEFLNSRMESLNDVELQYHIKDISFPGNGEDRLVFVFARVDPFKYFSFTEVVYTPDPEKIREFTESIAAEISRNYTGQRVLAVLGYTNFTFYSATPETFGREYTDYLPFENSWKVERFYAAALGRDGGILDTWVEPRL
ncbi:MAG: S-layer homology domain-containing protein [Bacillota bacterium]